MRFCQNAWILYEKPLHTLRFEKAFYVSRKQYKTLRNSVFGKPAKRQHETLIKPVVLGLEFMSFPERVLKIYGKPIANQRFAFAFSPCAKTLISLGNISVLKEGETWSWTPYKTCHFYVSWSTLREKARKGMEDHYVLHVFLKWIPGEQKPYKTNGKLWLL